MLYTETNAYMHKRYLTHTNVSMYKSNAVETIPYTVCEYTLKQKIAEQTTHTKSFKELLNMPSHLLPSHHPPTALVGRLQALIE